MLTDQSIISWFYLEWSENLLDFGILKENPQSILLFFFNNLIIIIVKNEK